MSLSATPRRAAARKAAGFVARSLHTAAGMLLARASPSTLRASSISHHIYGTQHYVKSIELFMWCALLFADEHGEAATFLRGALSLAEECGDRRMTKRVQRFLDPCLDRLENR